MTDGPKCPVPEIPDFELIREIGRGGFGQVWLARNRATGLLRAVKVIPRATSASPDPAGRELVSITRLETVRHRRHPNLLDIHHVGQTDALLFYVTDLADTAGGQPSTDPSDYVPATLEQRLSRGPASPAECLGWTRQLLGGLASLHAAGMVHRDVKPANCLFVDGQLNLADFGLLTEADSHTSWIGTQAYMPPDGRMDTRADVYAAGLAIYEMLTGHRVEQFPQLAQRAGSIVSDPVLSTLLKLVLDACRSDREERFPDANSMLAALEKRLAKAARPVRWPGRVAIAVAAVAILAMVTWGASQWAFLPPGLQVNRSIPSHIPGRPAGEDRRRVHVNFVTYPFGASVLLDGKLLLGNDGRPATTPCTIDNIPAGPHDVVFRHPELADLRHGTVDFRTERQVVGSWDVPEGESDPQSSP
ncbi:MAG: serine/threonine protein kinase [Pirellulales bacterium]|nr:serine/threonine protein kinase [Pirellulales bacterium]